MPPHPHCHWRGAEEWKSMGLEMSCTSDEACKSFDACLTQVVNQCEDPGLGGIDGCMKKMFQSDPDFLMGHVLELGLSGQLVQNDFSHAQKVYKLAEMSRKPHVKSWEWKHAAAIQYFCEGKTNRACQTWEDILVDHPIDMLSLTFLQNAYLINGLSVGLQNSTGRVLPQWLPHFPFYGNLLSMHAFGLEEMNQFDVAEKLARQALEINHHDAWAAHCVAHVKEMTGNTKEGITFMSETENNWNDSNLTCHNYWHWALYHVENGELEPALTLLDNHILPFLQDRHSMHNMADVASLMFRMEVEGCTLDSRWDDCYEVCKNQLQNHVFSYFDVNSMLSCLRSKRTESCNHLIEGIKNEIKYGDGDIHRDYKYVTLPVLEALQAYDDQEFDKAVEIMKPLKYQLYRIGGSNAQRDLLNIFTMHAGMCSKKQENRNYAKHLIFERKILKGESPSTMRHMKQLCDVPLVKPVVT